MKIVSAKDIITLQNVTFYNTLVYKEHMKNIC
jgi:hypothetical protein